MNALNQRPGLVLAIDTSTRSSLVLLGGDQPDAVSRREVQYRHGSHVLAQVDEVLAESGHSIDAVTAVAVGTGPGSFTGLRVGLATAKTLAYARSLPIVGVSSADALRRAVAGSAGAPADI
ncbi:MAG: tRNA (adenosine(37)-N6)-threonylcarbamoyltransferase complex dimerization subunit type 1 TsaB, partial [Chloroflexota bacterium]